MARFISFCHCFSYFESSLNNLLQKQLWPKFMLFCNIFNGLGHPFKLSLAKSAGGRVNTKNMGVNMHLQHTKQNTFSERLAQSYEQTF